MHAWALGVFEKFRETTGSPPLRSKNSWTLLGGVAIGLWATWPALSLQTRTLPAFECMTFIFILAWAVTAAINAFAVERAGRSASNWQTWLPAIAFACGESGSTVFFLLACRRIPAAEANLIIFLWPGITVAFAAVLGAFRIRVRHVIGIAMGFAGVVVLMGAGLSASLAGVGLALLGSLCWAFYCVFRLLWKDSNSSPLARGFALCTLLCVGLHGALESWVMPDLRSAVAVAVIAVVPTAVANLLWDAGLRRGDGRLLAVMSYATPLGSALLLTGLGLQAYSWRLTIGAIIIVVAGLMSRSDRP